MASTSHPSDFIAIGFGFLKERNRTHNEIIAIYSISSGKLAGEISPRRRAYLLGFVRWIWMRGLLVFIGGAFRCQQSIPVPRQFPRIS